MHYVDDGMRELLQNGFTLARAEVARKDIAKRREDRIEKHRQRYEAAGGRDWQKVLLCLHDLNYRNEAHFLMDRAMQRRLQNMEEDDILDEEFLAELRGMNETYLDLETHDWQSDGF